MSRMGRGGRDGAGRRRTEWDPSGDPGFTLVELLMMMVVVGVLAGLGFVSYAKVQDRASQARADAYWHDLMTAARAYHFEWGEFPAGIADLLTPDEGDPYLEAATWSDEAEAYDGGPTFPQAVIVYRLLVNEEAVCTWFHDRKDPVGSRYNVDECEM